MCVRAHLLVSPGSSSPYIYTHRLYELGSLILLSIETVRNPRLTWSSLACAHYMHDTWVTSNSLWKLTKRFGTCGTGCHLAKNWVTIIYIYTCGLSYPLDLNHFNHNNNVAELSATCNLLKTHVTFCDVNNMDLVWETPAICIIHEVRCAPTELGEYQLKVQVL